MTLHWTESFIGFNRTEGDPTLAESDAFKAAFVAAGYFASTGEANARMAIASDPLIPARAVLKFVRMGVLTTNAACALGKLMPNTPDDIYIGFSLYIPPTYVPTTLVQQSMFRLSLYPEVDPGATFAMADSFTAYHEALGINSNLDIVNNGIAQSVTKPLTGVINYFEIRIRDLNVSVWLNDALVLQKTLLARPETAVWQANALTNNVAFPHNWMVSNIYILTGDSVVPNVRLGPTTRVIGRRPATDVQAEFVRPIGAASNAEVVAQSVSATPAQSLQTTAVGTKDIYAIASDGDTAGASLVHAVATKVIASNFEAIPHSLRSFVKSSSTEGSEPGPRTFQAPPVSQIGTEQLNAVALHPTKGLVAVGAGLSMYVSTDNGYNWTQVATSSGSINYNDIHFCPETGNGIAVRSDGQIAYCHNSSPITSWTTMASGITSALVAVWGSGNTFMAVSSVATAGHTRKITYPLDTTPTVASATTVPTGGMSDVCFGGGYWMIKGVSSQFYRSTDATTWETINPASLPSQSIGKMLAYTGSAWVCMGTDPSVVVTTTTSWISTDNGLTWSGAGTITGTQLRISGLCAIGSMVYATGYTAYTTPTGGLVSGDDSTSIYYSRDNGLNWVLMGMLVNETSGTNRTTDSMLGVCNNGLGDPAVVGQKGRIRTLLPRKPEVVMPVLGGNVMVYGQTGVNPNTALPWTPTAAAAAQIGMVVSS